MPRVSDHFVKSAIRLLRQSTTVPNTSNTRAFTSSVWFIVFPFDAKPAGFVIARSACDEAIQILLAAFWTASLSLARTVGLQHLPVLNESQIIRDLVIERAGLRIVRLRQPIDAAGTRRLGLAINLFDQCAPQSEAARILRHIEVLKIAVAIMCPGRTMEQVMCDAEQPAVEIAAQRKQRLVRIVKPRPGGVADLLRQRRPVESEVTRPKRVPRLALVFANCTDQEIGAHGLLNRDGICRVAGARP